MDIPISPIPSQKSLIHFNKSYIPVLPTLPPHFKGLLPPDFKFGYASAAVQVEGAAQVDGKSLSIWDTFAAQPGKISDATRPDVANDEYRLLNETIALLKMTGSNIYRFSIAWPRLVPGGFRGSDISPSAVDHYNVLIDALLENGITPFVTIYHWVCLARALFRG